MVATVMEPLREQWASTLSTAERQKTEGRNADALATVRAFHESLCRTRVLDPACGTGNFLYVSLELLKRLEGEVLEAVADLGGQEALRGLAGYEVGPQQFLGMEINPRAAAIAELVLWIGHLQWHVRTKGGVPNEPVLQAFKNIQVKDAVLDAEKVLARNGSGVPLTRAALHLSPPAGRGGAAQGSAALPLPVDGERVGVRGESADELYEYRNPRRPDWPGAEFIVGNPPFIGGKDIRERMGAGYVQALWAVHPQMNESADFVMYWWDRAAELLVRKSTPLQRFGFVTTNSISQVFQRRVTERHLRSKIPVSMLMAIPDHPWTKATKDAAAVRIAMTVCAAGRYSGVLHEVTREGDLDTDEPKIEFQSSFGAVNSDLTVGVDVTTATSLLSNEGICSPGVKLHGAGFIVSRAETEHLGLGKRDGLDAHIKPYRNGRDLTARSRDAMVIDLFGLSAEDVRRRFPEVYQHVATTVKPEREAQSAKSKTKDAEGYAKLWWLFGKPRQELRPALVGLPRYIVTVETTKHRVFQFLDGSILPDNMLVAIGSADACDLGVLSSNIHQCWALRAGGWLGIGNDPRYSKSRCFDPFPFPAATEAQRAVVRELAEDLDAHRKRVFAEHSHLTLTGLYNVLEKLRAGTPSDALDERDRCTFDDGLVLILRELHDRLDGAVADTYGWPVDLSEKDVLARLVALNATRAAEEAKGFVRWLRPDYQVARFGSAAEKAALDLGGDAAATGIIPASRKPNFPAGDLDQHLSIALMLAGTEGAIDASSLAGRYKQGRRVLTKIEAVLAAGVRTGQIASDGHSFIIRRS